MHYIAYTFSIISKGLLLQTAREILIAELGEAGFESFTETETGVVAYIQEKDWNENILQDIQLLDADSVAITYEKETIAQVNWNAEWEKNFEPIEVEELVSVRAPFHKKPHLKYDIVIEPKMSFGTGHHETTHMMIQHLIDLDLEGKTVLDMGCGTGILAIFAEMKGAKQLDAMDIDNWCYLNSLENVERNNCKYIEVFEGDAALLQGKSYDVIIANINRNILLQDIQTYVKSLNDGGTLLLSGFYTEDIAEIEQETKKYKLQLEKSLERNNWAGLKFVKQKV